MKNVVFMYFCFIAYMCIAHPIQSMLGSIGNKYDNNESNMPDGYITKGLIAMWDGEWNAGIGIHDQNTKIWVDISGNGNDLAVVNDGNVHWEAQSLENQKNNFTTTYFAKRSHDPGQFATIEIIFRNDLVTQTRYIIRPVDVLDHEWHGLVVYSSKLSIGYGSYSALQYSQTLNEKCHFSASFDSKESQSIVRADINGISSLSLTSGWARLKDDSFIIGGANANANAFVGAIYCIRLYSMPLSKKEALHNYEIDKMRFNLP